MGEIIRIRTNQELNITLETPYYDIVRIKVSLHYAAHIRQAGPYIVENSLAAFTYARW